MALDTNRRRAIIGWRALGEEEIAKKQKYAESANPPKELHSEWRLRDSNLEVIVRFNLCAL
jgi:hypothetical protein